MSTPRFLVAPEMLAAGRVTLAGPELHHLRVRRLRAGSELILFDGLGQQRRGVVVVLDRHLATIDLLPEEPLQRESPLHLVLAQALLKHDKMDWVIEKATELGVEEILIFSCGRTVSRAGSDRLARWNRVARSAAKQCQRSRVPPVTGPVSFPHLLEYHTDAARCFFWEEGSQPEFSRAGKRSQDASHVLAVVGPEGGFAADEAAQAAAAGFEVIGLGPRILRAETAALVAVTLCQFVWGDLAWVARAPS